MYKKPQPIGVLSSLSKVFDSNGQRIYYLTVDSDFRFYYEGFNSDEDAKQALRNAMLADDHNRFPKPVCTAYLHMIDNSIWDDIQ